MLKINENNRINAKDIYFFIDVKTPFHTWVKRCIDQADLELNKDFCTILTESTGGRPATIYEFTIQAAKEICIISATKKAKELRRWLIEISEQKENLELVTVKQVGFALKVINCLKFIDNQKEAKQLHQKSFLEKNKDSISEKWIYAEFEKYRSKITGWDKQKIDEALDLFLQNHSGYPQKIKYSNQQTKLSAIDIGEAIRVAVTDILFSRNENETMSQNFAKLCKNLANEINLQASQTNEQNLFQPIESIENIKQLSIPK